jgi:hypothetical protein
LVYKNVYHPSFLTSINNIGSNNDRQGSALEWFVACGLFELMFSGGALYKYLCGGAFGAPSESSFREYFVLQGKVLNKDSSPFLKIIKIGHPQKLDCVVRSLM